MRDGDLTFHRKYREYCKPCESLQVQYVIDATTSINDVYRAENRIEKELEMMEKALRVTIANYSDESAETAIAKCNLACRSYASDRKSSRARNLLEQSLATLTRYE